MGYLDNSIVTVDAILTKKGRELLARGDGSFKITQFAVSDDEIDYTLYNQTITLDHNTTEKLSRICHYWKHFLTKLNL